MRFMMVLKATPESEAGVRPNQEVIDGIIAYNQELVKAGVLVDLGGLHPTSDAIRVTMQNGQRTLMDGPFAETKELISGYWIIDVKSRDEAIEWAMRAPNCHNNPLCQVELRQFYENAELTDDEATAAKVNDLREHLEQQRKQ